MAFVDSAINAPGSAAASADITLDVGTGTSRKVIAFVGAEDPEDTSDPHGFVYDPAGDNEAATLIGSEQVIFLTAQGWWRMAAFYYDLADGVTGTKTFRGTISGDNDRIIVGAIMHDGCATGAPEVNEATSFVDIGGTTDAITDAITTLTNDAVIFTGTIGANIQDVADFFTPDNGQTQREEARIGTFVGMAIGDLAKATAGAQTVGWSGTQAYEGGIQILASVAPAAAAAGTILPQMLQHYYNG